MLLISSIVRIIDARQFTNRMGGVSHIINRDNDRQDLFINRGAPQCVGSDVKRFKFSELKR